MSKIRKVSIIDEVVKKIHESITNGDYPVGGKLPTEMELRERLGVGRSTVREAFRVLQALGLIELRSGKGAYVRNSRDVRYETIRNWFVEKMGQLSELMELRTAIEPLAVKLAIQRGSAAQIRKIKEIHAAFRRAVQNKNVAELASLDEAFHDAIVRASNNSIMIKIGGLLAEELAEYRTRSFAVLENASHALVPHEQIMQAIVQRDEKQAIAWMEKHLEITQADMEGLTQSHG